MIALGVQLSAFMIAGYIEQPQDVLADMEGLRSTRRNCKAANTSINSEMEHTSKRFTNAHDVDFAVQIACHQRRGIVDEYSATRRTMVWSGWERYRVGWS